MGQDSAGHRQAEKGKRNEKRKGGAGAKKESKKTDKAWAEIAKVIGRAKRGEGGKKKKQRGPQESNFGEIRWAMPTFEDFAERVKEAGQKGGAAGPDGWTGKEMGNLPALSVEDLFQVQKRWSTSGEVPQAMKMARMTNLTKGKKVKK